MPKPKLAIVSNYGVLCGIAGYTHALKQQIEADFEVTILNLDQFLLRSADSKIGKAGDAHIAELAKTLSRYDFVNLQFEFGTLGYYPQDIRRRFRQLLRSAPGLSVTFHSAPPKAPSLLQVVADLARLRFSAAYQKFHNLHRSFYLSTLLMRDLRKAQRTKPISVIVHTKREAVAMRLVHGLAHVYDHPLAFLSTSAANDVRKSALRSDFPALASIPSDAKLIGVFGFVSRYKNTKLAIRALHLLPDNYHLLIFGAVHPNEIREFAEVEEYMDEVLSEAAIGASYAEKLCFEFGAATSKRKIKSLSLTINVAPGEDGQRLTKRDKGDLFGRVHFLGAMDDPGFFAGMTICDAVVVPYLEVGQSSSGVLAQALELGCRVLAARNHAFMEFSNYHPGRIEFFDIGNYVELAERIISPPPITQAIGPLDRTTDTNRQVYRSANDAKFPRPPCEDPKPSFVSTLRAAE